MIPSRARHERLLASLGLHPRADHALILDAILVPDDGEAVAAWRRWRDSGGTLDDADEATQNLLTAAHARVARLLPDDPDLGRLRGLHRRSLYWYRMATHRAVPLVQALGARGIPVLLSKGAAMVARNGIDPGSRPMRDLDLAVPFARAAEALEAAAASGNWRAGDRLASTDCLIAQHARHLVHRENFQIDLHWHLLVEAAFPGADDVFWARAVPVRWEDQRVLVLSPTDALFHTLVQDTADAAPSPRFILDAAALLAGGDIEWPRLLELGRLFQLTLTLEGALRTLRRFHQNVREDVLEALSREPVPPGRWLYHELMRLRRGSPLKPLRVLSIYWTRRGRGRGILRALAEFPRYLRAKLARQR